MIAPILKMTETLRVELVLITAAGVLAIPELSIVDDDTNDQRCGACTHSMLWVWPAHTTPADSRNTYAFNSDEKVFNSAYQ